MEGVFNRLHVKSPHSARRAAWCARRGGERGDRPALLLATFAQSSVCDGGVQREAAAPSSAAISNAGG